MKTLYPLCNFILRAALVAALLLLAGASLGVIAHATVIAFRAGWRFIL